MKKSIHIEERAECNSLLGKPDNLAIYTILYYGMNDNKRFTIKEIVSEVEKKFSMSIASNKVNYVLKGFVEKDIVRKSVKNGIYKYYLYKKIYTPSQNTPIPIYQISLLIIGFISMLTNFTIIDNTLTRWMSLTFFGTVLLVVIFHQFMFEYKG